MANTEPEAHCLKCGADWSQGHWTEGCEECGGGALERPCLLCGGRCGGVWRKAVMDSNDFGASHWYGECLLPESEQRVIERELERKRRELESPAERERKKRYIDQRMAQFRSALDSKGRGD